MAKRKTRRRMTAKQLKYFGKRRSHKRRPRRNPSSITYSPSAARSRSRTRRQSHSAVSYVRRRARSAGGLLERYGFDTVLPASMGAAGALALDMAWGYLPIPSTLQTGPLAPVVRLAGAVGIGMAATAIAGKKFGRDVTAGATVVTLYDLFKGFIKTNYPSIPLQGLGRYSPGVVIGRPRLGMYVGNTPTYQRRLGMYVGEYTPDYVNEYTTDSAGVAYSADPEPQY